ncbi:hypothetical protein OMW55_11055 [Sphingomonas sp. BN140010]|uniref:SPOR domain-containing protein n=1 Tax=Sphingomonas arvum TaxID=2992113 RepID=A0ABT3JHT8_9SPHN|nr:hypothetical protein [Sphingomonas sp. BN140010]MCW3798341.1 hypothetical protein [Sphingomonas sp. BN140010]
MLRQLAFSLCAAAILPASAHAQYIGGNAPPPPLAPPPGVAESPSAALARHIRTLAGSPRDYNALLGAGKAALDTGDAEAAIGFYGRAGEVNPASWVPKIGQGAALVQLLDPGSAMQAFDTAQRLGARPLSFALDRGLAYDLLGDQARAQADYRIALGGTDPNEARRRLALSLAVSGRRAEALTALDPLLARRDPGALRARAFVLALTGDPDGARSAVNVALPGLAGSMDPFLRRLATLRPAEKVAAVHFGVIPGSGQALASATPRTVGDRLGNLDQLLRSGEPQPPPAPVPAPVIAATPYARPVYPRPSGPPAASAVPASRPRIWLQLASGDPATLPAQFRRLKDRNRDLLSGIDGYLVQEAGRARLLIGPFRNAADARTFADDLGSADIAASSWTNAPGQQVTKLPPQ